MLTNLITDEGKYYLYRHIRLDKNEPFYIGIGLKSTRDVKYNTYSRAYRKLGRSDLWQKIINKTKYKIEILVESNNKQYIQNQEEYFIQLYGRKNLNTGSLANLTNGGEFNNGRICSNDLKQKRSTFAKNRWAKFTFEERQYINRNANPRNQVKVINKDTNKIYNSINEAYESTNKEISKSHFTAMLSNKYENKTKYIKYNGK